jgi:hypothetical protein
MLAAQLAQQPGALGGQVMAADRLGVLLRSGDEHPSGTSAKRSTTPMIIARTQSSTARGRRCARSTTDASSLRFTADDHLHAREPDAGRRHADGR